jgi:predicted small lipoprotein YifL
MKQRFIWITLVLLLLLAAAGCGQKAAEVQVPDNRAETPAQSAPELPSALLREGWPADSVPSDLPEYAGGTVVNSGGDDEEFYIKIEDTDKDALDKYLQELKDAGWIVTGGSDEAEAVKGLHTVNFDWQGGGTMLQMSLRTGEAGSWPSDKIPPDVLQPQTGALVEGVEIQETTESSWYFNYTYDGIDEEAARQYMELLRENGWSGDDTQLYKSFEWKGEQYGAAIEIYETVETRTTFTCNFYLGG